MSLTAVVIVSPPMTKPIQTVMAITASADGAAATANGRHLR